MRVIRAYPTKVFKSKTFLVVGRCGTVGGRCCCSGSVKIKGVGRIRHVSGKLLWMQSKVLNDDAMVHQVPTVWNYGDIGMKSLSKNRLLFLLCGVSVVDAETCE